MKTKITDEEYRWSDPKEAPADLIERFPELPAVVVQLLSHREITDQASVDGFLNPDYGQDTHDPFLFRDMRKLVDRVKEAVDKKQNVVVYGDYDADGVCSSSLLVIVLRKIGLDPGIYIPHRDTEGYGLNMGSVQKLADDGTDLIITVDCGISNKEEVERAVELGVDVIITDHHSEPTELPNAALAILDAKVEAETYPFEYLAGVGVAFKVAQALIQEYELGESFEKWLLDLVAISTVTDFVELIGENRVLLKYGLVVLRKNRRVGLKHLLEVMAVDPASVDEITIGFKIGPPINAAGRMDHANAAFELMVEENEVEAQSLALNLSKTNKERQAVSREMGKQAMVQAEEQKDEQLIIVESDDWPLGLVGLVAGQVSSRYQRPVFVVTKMGGDIVGSGRSIEQFNLVDGLQSMDELFDKYGGHAMACGFTLKGESEFADFKTRMRARAKEFLEGADLRRTLNIEAELSLAKTDWDLVSILEQFSPFGQANPQPVFVTKAVSVVVLSAVGKKADHLRMTVEQDGTKRPCIGFGLGEWADKLKPGDLIDLAFTAGINEWNGNREIQLELKDVRRHES